MLQAVIIALIGLIGMVLVALIGLAGTVLAAWITSRGPGPDRVTPPPPPPPPTTTKVKPVNDGYDSLASVAADGTSDQAPPMSPTLADQIRKYTYETYIKPAIRTGQTSVRVRAGDVHGGMGLTARFPAVCGALGTQLFLEQYNLKLLSKEGPSQGANVYFTYALPSSSNMASQVHAKAE